MADSTRLRPRPTVSRPVTKRSAEAPHLRLIQGGNPLPAELTQRDPALIRRAFPLLAALSDHYFRAEVTGVEHLSDRASIMAATHNGGYATPDLYCLLVAFWRRFGMEAPAYGLTHQVVFKLPGLGSLFTRFGGIPANRRNAALVLRAGFPLLVCPGGDIDALKPFRQRHQVLFGNRTGFVRIAIEEQVPIIPVVSVGAHETMFVLNDGRRLAEISRAARYFRIKSIPFALSFPLGLTPAGIFSFPLPAKIRISVLPPIELGEPASAATNREVVVRCAEHVRCTMQRALDKLAARRRRVFFG